jgi:hypothetical protein
MEQIITQADKDSAAYKIGFEHGKIGKEYRNPCSGNPIGENAYYFGFLAGQSAREQNERDRAAMQDRAVNWYYYGTN